MPIVRCIYYEHLNLQKRNFNKKSLTHDVAHTIQIESSRVSRVGSPSLSLISCMVMTKHHTNNKRFHTCSRLTFDTKQTTHTLHRRV
ncbi:MAG: hypothetical protein ACI8RD_010285 [Bacillariaceae sp.]|jgi:hypothetical protein